jgi:hypothetical protein
MRKTQIYYELSTQPLGSSSPKSKFGDLLLWRSSGQALVKLKNKRRRKKRGEGGEEAE